jgi:hypothetical protein
MALFQKRDSISSHTIQTLVKLKYYKNLECFSVIMGAPLCNVQEILHKTFFFFGGEFLVHTKRIEGREGHRGEGGARWSLYTLH